MSGHDVEKLPGWRGGDGNAAYLDKTLRHHDVEISFDDTVNWKVFLTVWLRAAGVGFGVFLFFGFIGLITLAGDPESGLGLMGIGLQISIIAFVVVFLASKVTEPIGEWRVLLADQWMHTESAYSEIARVVQERRLPIVPVFRRIRTGGRHPYVTHRMVLQDGSYVAYLSVFPYGTSLYMGWVMWRNRRGTEIVGQFFSDFFRGFGGTDMEKVMMRTEPPRAMREALHAAAREGLHVAVDGRTVSPELAFPHGLPHIEEDVAAPLPVQAQAPTPMPPPPVPPRQPWTEGGR
ncbi:hypothetical protein ABZ434_14250 [Streptomyces sp. NPDC005761]|uniref:hypothetical protein n=1 Tax=unclassified Streptomyces TaxID=2593676 RepID=UPI0033D1F1B8